MNKIILSVIVQIFFSFQIFAQDYSKSDSLIQWIQEVEKAFTYQYGELLICNNVAKLNVPEGYKYLDSKQSQYVLNELWGNPPDSSVSGMLFPEDNSPVSENFKYAIVITYNNEGYISDDEADDIDYEDLLVEIKKSIDEEKFERQKNGYPTYTLIGWAMKPFYDKENKVLHWAKEVKFDDTPVSTLNYDARILGRNGYLSLNVIGDITILKDFKKDSRKILESTKFTKGNRYTDFNSKTDHYAEYGIGALIAGKVLAKVGFWALVVKFGKFIAIGVAGLIVALRKKIFKNKDVADQING